jgi:hypothetical protein
VRFLDEAEESRLRQALQERDELMKNTRALADDRRQSHSKVMLAALTLFEDHVTPAVLLTMNTGLRRSGLGNRALPLNAFQIRSAYPFVKMVEREGLEPSTPAL